MNKEKEINIKDYIQEGNTQTKEELVDAYKKVIKDIEESEK